MIESAARKRFCINVSVLSLMDRFQFSNDTGRRRKEERSGAINPLGHHSLEPCHGSFDRCAIGLFRPYCGTKPTATGCRSIGRGGKRKAIESLEDKGRWKRVELENRWLLEQHLVEAQLRALISRGEEKRVSS